jgi:hypothetical protein
MEDHGERHREHRHHDQRKRADKLVRRIEGKRLKRRWWGQEASRDGDSEIEQAEHVPAANQNIASRKRMSIVLTRITPIVAN